MISLAFVLAAQAVSVPRLVPPDGSKLRPGTSCYAIVRGSDVLGATLQTIRPVRARGVPAWEIVVHQRIAGGRFDMRDSFVVRRSDLTPINFNSVRGQRSSGKDWHQIRLDYAGGRVTGSKATAAGIAPIDVNVGGRVWDANLWGLTFAALPLRAGRSFRLPNWHYEKGAGSFTATVIGSERVAVGGRRVDAWIVEAGDDPKRLARYLIAKSDRSELGYGAGGAGQRLGGDCTGMR